jgi:protein O-mannosyl-transferase
VALAALVLHATSLRGPFLYDDQLTVLGNPSLGNDDWVFWIQWERFRPLTNLTYILDHELWGFDPFGYHLTSLLLHAVNSALVFMLARRWEEDGRARAASPWVPVAASLLFAVHPLLTQGVSYVSGRSEPLCAVFFLAGLLSARRAVVDGAGRWLAAAVVCLVLGTASKELGALMPLAAVLYVLLRLESPEVRARARMWLGPLVGVVLLAGAARVAAFFVIQVHQSPRGFLENLALEAIAFWKYARLLVAPVGQSLVHSVESSAAMSVLGAAGLVALAAVALRLRKKRPEVAFGAAWFALLILPPSVIPLVEPMAEHRAYVASIGVFIAVAALCAPLLAQRGGRIGFALGCVALAGLTARRNQVWADETKLWSEAVERAGDSWRSHYGLGEALRAEKNCAAAIPEYERAAALAPRPTDALLNLGICQATVGRPAAAYQAFSKVLEREPKNAAALTDLATLALMSGAPATAKAYLLRAAEAEPGDPTRRARAEQVPNEPDARPWPPRE